MFLEARWSSVEAALGNTLNPKKLEDAPTVSLSRGHGVEFVITLTDPDAPSRKDSNLSPDVTRGAAGVSPHFGLVDLSEGTGKHRYVFLALVPQNGTIEKLHLSKPSDRQYWGYDTDDGETRGVREWAKENGLIPVGNWAANCRSMSW
ncbi:hypothetical protein B0T14DRAFT_537369 [Immersiella caudata]|uniref:PEBP-like protein n=1 Tax=Immersiella caudata TaxID=314043 RepID=A0AA39WQK0_9PEZI|nr:hypothetical protein B0T14DRAFT_537369 [Immersiella caudata]